MTPESYKKSLASLLAIMVYLGLCLCIGYTIVELISLLCERFG